MIERASCASAAPSSTVATVVTTLATTTTTTTTTTTMSTPPSTSPPLWPPLLWANAADHCRQTLTDGTQKECGGRPTKPAPVRSVLGKRPLSNRDCDHTGSAQLTEADAQRRLSRSGNHFRNETPNASLSPCGPNATGRSVADLNAATIDGLQKGERPAKRPCVRDDAKDHASPHDANGECDLPDAGDECPIAYLPPEAVHTVLDHVTNARDLCACLAAWRGFRVLSHNELLLRKYSPISAARWQRLLKEPLDDFAFMWQRQRWECAYSLIEGPAWMGRSDIVHYILATLARRGVSFSWHKAPTPSGVDPRPAVLRTVLKVARQGDLLTMAHILSFLGARNTVASTAVMESAASGGQVDMLRLLHNAVSVDLRPASPVQPAALVAVSMGRTLAPSSVTSNPLVACAGADSHETCSLAAPNNTPALVPTAVLSQNSKGSPAALVLTETVATPDNTGSLGGLGLGVPEQDPHVVCRRGSAGLCAWNANQTHALDWLAQAQCPHAHALMCSAPGHAVAQGHVSLARWAVARLGQSAHCTRRDIEVAARQGHAAAVRWAHTSGLRRCSPAVIEAAARGNGPATAAGCIELLMWATGDPRRRLAPAVPEWRDAQIALAAASTDNVAVMQWISQAHPECVTPESARRAATTGNTGVILLLHRTRLVALDAWPSLKRIAAKGTREAVLAVAQAGAPYDARALKVGIKRKSTGIIQVLCEHYGDQIDKVQVMRIAGDACAFKIARSIMKLLPGACLLNARAPGQEVPLRTIGNCKCFQCTGKPSPAAAAATTTIGPNGEVVPPRGRGRPRRRPLAVTTATNAPAVGVVVPNVAAV